MLDPILKLFFFQICSTYFSNILCFCCCVLNSAPCGSDRLLPFKTLVLKMVNSPSSPAAASSPQFATASAVPPAQMSLSRCLSSDGTINIEKYRLCRQSAAAAFRWRSSVAKDSLLDGELNTHRVDHMVLLPLPRRKRNTLPEVSLRGKTRKMAHWRLVCRRIHCGTKRMSAIV